MEPKTLIVYLSLSGNTRKFAHAIASCMDNVDVKEVVLSTSIPKSKFGLVFKFGFYSLFKIPFSMKVPKVDIQEYETIVLGSPIWMGKVAIPLLQAIKKWNFRGKRVALFLTHNGDDGNAIEDFKTELNLTNLTGALSLIGSQEVNCDEVKEKIKRFITNLEA